MKTKLTILAAIIFAGIASTSAVIGRDWVYPQTNPKPAQSPSKDHCEMGGMSGMSGMNHMGGMCAMGQMSAMGGMCDMAAKPAGKGMACHSGAHGADGAAKEHKSCCN